VVVEGRLDLLSGLLSSQVGIDDEADNLALRLASLQLESSFVDQRESLKKLCPLVLVLGVIVEKIAGSTWGLLLLCILQFLHELVKIDLSKLLVLGSHGEDVGSVCEVKEDLLVHLLGQLDVDSLVEGTLAAQLVKVDLAELVSDLHGAHTGSL